MKRLVFCAAMAGSLSAGVIYNGGTGGTSFGATQYVCPGAPGPCTPPGPVFSIVNNFTGANDILTSPGGGYQVANPVLGNNISSTGIVNAPYFAFQIGGVSGDGSAFGSGSVLNLGSQIGFDLTDTAPGGGTASYMITSMLNSYTVDADGYNGTIGDYLAIAGNNFTGSDASVAAIRGSFSINGGAPIALPDIMLALAGNCNNQVAGTAVAFINACAGNGGNGGAFAGLAIGLANGGAAFNLVAGDTISVVTTLTAYADPASIDSLPFDDLLFRQLLEDSHGTLPGLSLADTGVAAAPEPATWLAAGAGMLALGLARRRRA